jgi:hypothetical protein
MTRATGRAAANVPKIASANAESKLASGWALPATMLVSHPGCEKAARRDETAAAFDRHTLRSRETDNVFSVVG